MLRRTLWTLVAGSAVLAALPGTASAAPDALRTYVLPGQAVFPEGVAVLGGTFYATSTNGGAVYRGDLRHRRAEVFIRPGPNGRTSTTGIKATATRLVIAGAQTGLVSVYDRRTGDRVAQFTNHASQRHPTFINDVAIAPNGDAYVTDSVRPVLYRIPAAKLAEAQAGRQPLRVFRHFTRTALPYRSGFNVNGIVATPDGRFVILGQSNTGKLFQVRLRDKQVRQVRIGARLTNNDGLVLLTSRVLYVIRNAEERVVEVRLGPAYRSGRVVSSTGDRDFQTPTTGAVAGDRLLIVNSQFNGPGRPPFTLTSIPLP